MTGDIPMGQTQKTGPTIFMSLRLEPREAVYEYAMIYLQINIVDKSASKLHLSRIWLVSRKTLDEALQVYCYKFVLHKYFTKTLAGMYSYLGKDIKVNPKLKPFAPYVVQQQDDATA